MAKDFLKLALALLAATVAFQGLYVFLRPLGAIEMIKGTASELAHPDFPITSDQPIFMVLEQIDGDKLTFRVLRSVSSHDSKTILWVGDEVRAGPTAPCARWHAPRRLRHRYPGARWEGRYSGLAKVG